MFLSKRIIALSVRWTIEQPSALFLDHLLLSVP
jgi:hypothetical protein